MQQRAAWVLAVLTSLAPACAPSVTDGLGRRQDDVIAGTIDTGDPAVVALMDGGYFFCSGSLIAPHVVLTAAHCLEGGSASGLSLFFGTDSTAPSGGEMIDADEILPHPEYRGDSYDIGLIALSEAATVAPVSRNVTALGESHAGMDVRVVGFGTAVDFGDDSGKKRQGTVTFDSVEGDVWFYTPKDGQSGCYGDSGGPNFMMMGGHEVLAGVTSFGTEDSCLAGLGGNTDVLIYKDWIDDFISAHGDDPNVNSCAGDGVCTTGCDTPDPDCACAADGQCSAACPDWMSNDPDCSACGGGDTCNADCPAPDPDCTPAGPPDAGGSGNGNGGDSGDGGGADGGCGCVVTARAPASPWALLVLGLSLFVIRRKRR